VTARQIEAARRAIMHALKRRGKVWIRIFPITLHQKAAETRMGKGKGNVEYWVAVVKPGRVMFEVGGGLRKMKPGKHCAWLSSSWPLRRRSSAASTEWLEAKNEDT